MARVIGRDESAVKRVTCRNCAAIVEYTENDVREVVVRDYTGDADTYRRLVCPGCAKDITVR